MHTHGHDESWRVRCVMMAGGHVGQEPQASHMGSCTEKDPPGYSLLLTSACFSEVLATSFQAASGCSLSGPGQAGAK